MKERYKKPSEGQFFLGFEGGEITYREILPSVRVNLVLNGVDFSKLEPNYGGYARSAYIKQESLEMMKKRTEFIGTDQEFLKTLVVFPVGTEIKFQNISRNKYKLNISTVVHEVESRDQIDVPCGCRWYQVISSLIDDDRKMEKKCITYRKEGGEHPYTLGSGEYFYARPECSSKKVCISVIGKNGFGSN
ncbi:MAG: hypothetical protein KIH89_001740 [Candidatus Shapirobacteria bacterium]|nr:hypothetical protein [Candidatus Shapirobacteria bacterium]